MSDNELKEANEAMALEEALAASERKWLDTPFYNTKTRETYTREQWYLMGYDPDEDQELEEV